ncbi:hypothetical protein PRIPAC_75823 [Pristionchus pacificus]|nr:hypothetical protein PRIPAC_75823 [Pristionchus pacificus]
MIRDASTRFARQVSEMVIVAKDPKASGNIHYGRNSLTRLRARVYTFLDHPRYQKNYLFYFPAILYHVVLYFALCVTGLTLEMRDHNWLREFARQKWGLIDFDARWCAEVIGMVCSVFLVAEYVLRVWSCVSNNVYGGDPKELNAARIRENHRRGRLRYCLEWLNLLELVITIVTAFAYFVWTPHSHLRFAIFARAIHWDKSVHAWRLIQKIGRKGFRIIVPSWAIAYIIMALQSCAVYNCEMYYRLENETLADSDIKDLGQSLWYTYVTAMTIGYGDFTPKTALCRTMSIVLGYCSNGLVFSIQTAVSLFLVKHIAEEAHARNDKKVQNLAAKVIQSWARFHLCRRKFPSSDKFIEICCQKLYAAKQKIEKQRQVAGMMLPAKRLIKRAKRSSLTRQRSGVLDAFASPPPAHALARKRGSLPNQLHSLFSMTMATAAVFGNRVDSPDSAIAEDHDYSVTNQNTVDERFLRMHNKQAHRDSGISSISRCKTNREEFGPLVMMIQFLLFGHFKRRFRNTEFRKPPEQKVADEQRTMFGIVKSVENQFELLVTRHEGNRREQEHLERAATRISGLASKMTERMEEVDKLRKQECPIDPQSELRKRKATNVETEKKTSRDFHCKRKNTIV